MISITRKNPYLDITKLIIPRSFRKEDNLTAEVDICRFTLKKYGDRTYEPSLGEEIEIFDGATKIFAGTIEKIVRKTEGTKIALFECHLKDYTHSLDRKLVKMDYTDKSPEYIINSILTNYTDGSFTQNNVATTGITVEYIKFDYKEPSKCFQELAELIGYDWYVDYDKDIHFFDKGTGETAAFNVTDTNGNCIDGSLQISEDNRQIRNVIYVRGGEYVADSRTDKVGEGDGTTKIFKLPYRYDSEPTITVGGSSQTVGIDFIDSEDDYDCLWNYQEKVIKFKTAPASGDVVVTGSPRVAVLIKAQDNASVSANGIYEYRIVDKKIKTKEAARRRAQAEMVDYAEAPEEAKFRSYTSGMRSGMMVNISSDILNKNENFIVTKAVTTMLTNKDRFQYEFSLTTKRAMGIIAYLQRQIALLNNTIGVIEQEGEVTDVIVTIEGIDTVSATEAIEKNKYLRTLSDTITITSNLLNAGIDDPPIWVAGKYQPTSSTDRKRPAFADRSCYLAS